MRVVGLDLAGSPRNGTGYCLLLGSEGLKTVSTRLLHSDDEIMAALGADAPLDVVAVDAPLAFDGSRRSCDELLRGYGALPVTLRGMETLARRGKILADMLDSDGYARIEVHSTSSAKILGVYHKDDLPMQKALMGLGLRGELDSRLLTRDELDAIVAALTGYLYILRQTREVGDDRGRIVIPDV